MLSLISKKVLGYVVLASFVCIPVSYAAGYWRGYDAGKATQKIKNLETVIEVENENQKRTQEIRRLDDGDLVSRYCRWVYDMPYAECIKTVKPIR